MSFILDALKKSESERQRQASPTLADVARPVEKQKTPAWLWVLGALLLFNVAVLIGIYFRPATEAVIPPPMTLTEEPTTARPAPDVQEPAAESTPIVSSREQPRPLAAEAATAAAKDTEQRETIEPAPAAESRDMASDFDATPTYATLLANGTIEGGELHIDIHVYSDVAADRFVFINMNKYREGQQLVEGPRLIAITPDGAILQQSSYRFLLPRE
jgi:general secretion pathway protein B